MPRRRFLIVGAHAGVGGGPLTNTFPHFLPSGRGASCAAAWSREESWGAALVLEFYRVLLAPSCLEEDVLKAMPHATGPCPWDLSVLFSSWHLSAHRDSCKIANVNTKLVFNKNYPDGTKRKVVDNRIIKNLGWSSKISLDQGLLKTINWYKNNN